MKSSCCNMDVEVIESVDVAYYICNHCLKSCNLKGIKND